MERSDPLAELASAPLLGDELLRAIGCVAVESAYLEGTLGAYIGLACRFDAAKSKLFVTGVQLSKRVDLLREIYRPMLPASAHAEFAAIISNILGLIDQRNTIIHGLWYPPHIAITRNGLAAKGEPKATRQTKGEKPKRIRAPEALEVARKFAESHRALMRLLDANIRWNQLSPGAQAEPIRAVSRPSGPAKK